MDATPAAKAEPLPECVGCSPGTAPGTWAERNRRLAVLMSIAGSYFALLAVLHGLQPDNFWFRFWYIFPIALAICIIVCTFGIEGAILFVPFFAVAFPLFAFPLRPVQAVSIALITEVFGFTSSLIAFARAGLVDWKLGFTSAVWSVPFAVAGGFLSFVVPPWSLLIVVSGLLVLMAVFMVKTPSEYELLKREARQAPGNPGNPGPPAAGEERSLTDAQGRTYTYRYRHDRRRSAVVVSGGLFEGMVGFGIGIIGVSDLIFRRIPIRAAIGASHFIIMVTALAAISPHILEVVQNIDFVPWNVLVTTIPAVLIGGQTAAQVAGRVNPDRLRRVFTFLLVTLALITLTRVGVLFGR